ncbi:uncharacterized protein MJAP1_001642 [Malassezia japonica]|uniref:Mediator of RNA polymerase II transcription subunit 5 n=1 Tax=Malassezia japonica TaxID=223818 RepID=A0AAF0EXD8_9BASI|nr:uncharacterized protein MJAP1_001642 [Malassezia japonica]WFD38680.1 hypothetical protein MJAP1_001642 [Malassezia japonica]
MAYWLRGTVVAALGGGWASVQLLERVQEEAKERNEPVAAALHALPDALLATAFAVAPPPRGVLEYVRTLCVAPPPHTDPAEHDMGTLMLALLARAESNTQTADQICALILEGCGDDVPRSLTPARLAEHAPEHRFWEQGLQLVSVALALAAPQGAAAALFQRLAAHPHHEVLPERFENIVQQVDSACAHDAAWTSVAQALVALEKEPEEMAVRPTHTGLPDLWSGRQTLPYALALVAAAENRHTGNVRVAPLPPPPEPEPEMIYLVHRLSCDVVDWQDKCAMAEGMLQTRLAHADAEPDKMRLSFYVELLIATAHAAQTCVGHAQEAAPAWRAVIGGVLPPLLRFLDSESEVEAQRSLYGAISAFVQYHTPLSQWAMLEPPTEPALPEHILRCMASWGLAETHACEPISASEIVLAADPNLQQYRSSVQAQLTTRGGIAPLAAQAVSDPARQLCFALALAVAGSQWTREAADMDQVAEVCAALDTPGACEALFFFYSRASLCNALLTALEQLRTAEWQDAVDLETIGTVILFVQRIGVPTDKPSAATVFLTFTQVPTLPREALSDKRRDLLDRWCSALVSDGVSDALLRDSPPWTVFRLAPTLLQQLMGAYRQQEFDLATLQSALSYFLQAPLRYTLPCILHWLVQQVQYASATSIYVSAPHSTVHLEMLVMLLGAETCPPSVRAMFAPTVLPLLGDAHGELRDRLRSLPPSFLVPWPGASLALALGPDATASDAAAAFLQQRGASAAARWALYAALHTDIHASAARLVCATLALAPPHPGSEVRTVAACCLESAALARSMPGDPQAVDHLFALLSSRASMLRELLAGARPPLAVLAGALPSTEP